MKKKQNDAEVKNSGIPCRVRWNDGLDEFETALKKTSNILFADKQLIFKVISNNREYRIYNDGSTEGFVDAIVVDMPKSINDALIFNYHFSLSSLALVPLYNLLTSSKPTKKTSGTLEGKEQVVDGNVFKSDEIRFSESEAT
jgi:hypothetical protein